MRVFGWQTRTRNESGVWDVEMCVLVYMLSSTMGRPSALVAEIESEHKCWDPKDGELCLDRMKPEETLVEVRSRSDVQIDGRIWA